MEVNECVKILSEFNVWRRGKGKYQEAGARLEYTPKQIGIAIDTAISLISKPYTKQDVCDIIDLWEYAQYREPEPLEYITKKMNEE